MKVVNQIEAERILSNNGFVFIRQTGDHRIFQKEKQMVVTAGNGKRFRQNVWRKECRRVGIIL